MADAMFACCVTSALAKNKIWLLELDFINCRGNSVCANGRHWCILHKLVNLEPNTLFSVLCFAYKRTIEGWLAMRLVHLHLHLVKI